MLLGQNKELEDLQVQHNKKNFKEHNPLVQNLSLCDSNDNEREVRKEKMFSANNMFLSKGIYTY